jgi:hypothetical protein
MLDRKHKNYHYFILDRADRPPVPNAILPELAEFRAYEWGADATRIGPSFYSFVKEPQYTSGDLPIEFLQILSRTIAQPNLPAHILS